MAHEKSSDPLHIWMHVQSGLLGIILIITLLLNTLLITVLRKMKARRSKKNSASFSIERSYMYLLFHLAFADMLGVLLNIPFDILDNAGVEFWQSPFMCTMLGPIQLASTSAQAGTYVALSYHRFRAIVYPIRANLTVCKSILFIVIIWTVGVCLSLPYAVVLRITDEGCNEIWPQGILSSNIYTFAIFILQYAAPVTLMAIFYVSIAKTLQMHRTAKEQVNIPAQDDLRSHRHIVKMLVTIVTVFSVCMLPHHVLWIINGLRPMGSEVFRIATNVAYLFTYSNTVSNPAVFFWYNSESRYHLRQIFKKLRCYKQKLNIPFEFDVNNLMGNNSSTNNSKMDYNNHRYQSPKKTSKLDSYRLTQLFPTATDQGVSLPWEAQVLSSSDTIDECQECYGCDPSLSYSVEDTFLCTMPQTDAEENYSCQRPSHSPSELDGGVGLTAKSSDNAESMRLKESADAEGSLEDPTDRVQNLISKMVVDVEYEMNKGLLGNTDVLSSRDRLSDEDIHEDPNLRGNKGTRGREDVRGDEDTRKNKDSRKPGKTVNFSKNGEVWDNGTIRGMRTKQDMTDTWDMLSTGDRLNNNNLDNNDGILTGKRGRGNESAGHTCSLVENKDMTSSHDLVSQMISFLENSERDYRALQEHLRNLPEDDV